MTDAHFLHKNRIPVWTKRRSSKQQNNMSSPLTQGALKVHNEVHNNFTDNLRKHPATPSENSSEQASSCGGREAPVTIHMPPPVPRGEEDRTLGYNRHGNVELVECADGRRMMRSVEGAHVYAHDFHEFHEFLNGLRSCEGRKE